MKKILIILLAVFPLVFSSCKKDDHQPGTLTGTLEGFMDKDTKVVYDPSNPDSPFSWQDGDKIKVIRNSNTGKGDYVAALTEDNSKAEFTFNSGTDVTDDNTYHGKYYAVYPSTIHYSQGLTNRVLNYVNVKLADSYNTDANGNLLMNPMFAESASPDSKKLPFKHICGLLKLQLQKNGARIISVKVTATTAISGSNFKVISNNGIPYIDAVNNSVTDARKSVTLNFAVPQDLSSQRSFFIPLPQGDYSNLVIEFTTATGKKCVKTQQHGTLHIERAMYSTITLGETDLAFVEKNVGAKGGYFTIGIRNKRVRFSQGNLQYLASPTPTWRFATNQYDVCPQANNTAASSTSTNWIDMFGWGTSGYSTTDYGPSYPYNILQTDIYGPASGGFDASGDQNFDWGYHNAISNGGDSAGMWRTLTRDEWNYILKSRTDASNKWAKAIVNGQNGIILLPDTWSATGEPTYRGESSRWLGSTSQNTYTLNQWTALEEDGAIFLPQCGYRNGTSIQQHTSSTIFAYYWTSSLDNKNSYPYVLFCGETSSKNTKLQVNMGSTYKKYYGYNVRLVCDVE